ncbi:MAG: hypothetical protein K5661_04650 [Bacteroidales bacterium]|nr:hypothetical protein [Bacteroidales bacterium]
MRHPILLSFALLFAGTVATAQILNPVVEVTNTYEQAATGIEKPDQPIAVPDSLLKFNFDMDYEMRTTPYKGAYEFNPYLVELNPMPRSFGEGTLLVRLGAGYGLHPEADIVWSPLHKDNFRLNLYANHHSYFGKYRTVDLDVDNYFRGFKENLYSGADSNTSAGVNTLLNWKGGTWTADLHYQHLLASDKDSGYRWGTEFQHHVIVAQTRVKSAPQNKFYYNLGVRGNYLMRNDGLKGGQLKVDGGIGSNGRSQAHLDFFTDVILTQGGEAGQIGFIPRYIFRIGDLHLNLGVKVAFTFRSEEDFYPNKGGYVFPDAHLEYRVVPEDFILYASATGGNKDTGYAPLLMQNHFLPSFINNINNCGFDFEVEHVNIAAGARGNIGRRFHYDTKLGYALYSNAVLWGLTFEQGFMGGLEMHPNLYRAGYGLFYVDFQGGWTSEQLDIDAHLRYQSASLKGPSRYTEEVWDKLVSRQIFAPAAFTAQARVAYNWADRIKVGVDLDASTDRLTQPVVDIEPYGLPGYADLGLFGEYGFTRRFAFWLRVGNLLNQDIQRTPFHSERGIYFTAGLQYRF